jgi:hypothetical protein
MGEMGGMGEMGVKYPDILPRTTKPKDRDSRLNLYIE